eukprot:CAMPEP_0203957256 /NCGR_PEP_ID=MMETSP0359-20131031/89188_2 /ASSEMBLY_ACC=CAM_ASM_000338 /TAXON_ID=268821 /ORGANISM="Scrippsiella Hangoei, Strain SHTV-5" /LENGTH=164 /DNA_ID=CAMNT_0050891077 /DNA_START=105 /DNA_END=597 /DNA_ORIENTATION=-
MRGGEKQYKHMHLCFADDTTTTPTLRAMGYVQVLRGGEVRQRSPRVLTKAETPDFTCGPRALRHVGAKGEVVAGQRHDVVCQVPGDDVLFGDVRHARCAAQAHDHLQLVLQHAHHADDALLAVGRQGVEHRPADADACGAERDRLEDIRAAADAAIDEHREVLL